VEEAIATAASINDALAAIDALSASSSAMAESPVERLFAAQTELSGRHGPPGISCCQTTLDFTVTLGHANCLLWRDGSGRLREALYYFPAGVPQFFASGEGLIAVHPSHRRQGIATALLDEALRRWRVHLLHQRFTPSGSQFMCAYVARRASAGMLVQSVLA
jgi:GNAT superfamily N-acetyltransferase